MNEFVDTHILCYAYDSSAGYKHDSGAELLQRLLKEKTGTVSTQVLLEFYSIVTRKLRATSQMAEDALELYSIYRIHRPDYSSVIAAIHLQRRYKLAWFDAMILNSALETGCSILWTEDFSDGQRFGDLVIRNPCKNARTV